MAQANRIIARVADLDDIASIDANLTFANGHYIVIDAIRAQGGTNAAYTISAGARCVISASLSVTQWYAQQVTFTQQEEPCQN